MDTELCRATVAKSIRRKAKLRKVSIETLADLAGISRTHMWRILRCECSPTLDRIVEVANALDCKPRDLLP